jgi:hypothetical protein
MTPLQEFISRMVEDKGPIKGVDLAVEVATHQHGSRPDEITEALADLVECGEIVEVEYILERMNYRVKSMYFPKGTKVNPRVPI